VAPADKFKALSSITSDTKQNKTLYPPRLASLGFTHTHFTDEEAEAREATVIVLSQVLMPS
jgi:hypothetical protein